MESGKLLQARPELVSIGHSARKAALSVPLLGWFAAHARRGRGPAAGRGAGAAAAAPREACWRGAAGPAAIG